MRRLLGYALILVAGIVAGIWLSDGRVWELAVGSPDMGRATFDTTDRPSNQFIACMADDDGCLEPDLTIDPITRPPDAVWARLDEWLKGRPRLTRVDDGSDPTHRRYVVRSALLRFPDTVSVNATAEGDGTRLRISSRSQIGQSDFGVNGERIREWLAAIR